MGGPLDRQRGCRKARTETVPVAAPTWRGTLCDLRTTRPEQCRKETAIDVRELTD
ncbi:hypothetical protein PX52LOC_03709 [Limnoglobus roseus]|uniref:Uncharacterized protein n=1 Tax=Limnoglobus roseus TaxID=2598579 RepID=A0A5C1AEV4_9BACT|nr:hypothetical protein PX52LOC_03709 [Limnoglobus roseus]